MTWTEEKGADCEGRSRRPNGASREAIREWRVYENGERGLEDFEPALPTGGRDVLYSDDHVFGIVQAPRFKADLEAMGKEGVDLSRFYRPSTYSRTPGRSPAPMGPPPLMRRGLDIATSARARSWPTRSTGDASFFSPFVRVHNRAHLKGDVESSHVRRCRLRIGLGNQPYR